MPRPTRASPSRTNPAGAHEVLAKIAIARKDLNAALAEAQLARNDFLVATIFMMRDNPRSALPALQRVYDASRANGTPLPNGYFTLAGDVFLRLRRPNEARVAFERAVELHSEDAVARERLKMWSGR